MVWGLGDILNAFCGSDGEYLNSEDNKEINDEGFQRTDNRRMEIQVEENTRSDNIQTSINEHKELIALNPPSYLESFSHSCVSPKNDIETEDKQLTEKIFKKKEI